MKRLAAVALLALAPTLAGAQQPTQNTEILRILASPFGDTLRALAPALEVIDRGVLGVPYDVTAFVSPLMPMTIQFVRTPQKAGFDLTMEDVLAHEIGHVAFINMTELNKVREFVADVVASNLNRRTMYEDQRFRYGRDTVGVREMITAMVQYRLSDLNSETGNVRNHDHAIATITAVDSGNSTGAAATTTAPGGTALAANGSAKAARSAAACTVDAIPSHSVPARLTGGIAAKATVR